MSEPITYVGIDAHKVELHVALLAPDASAPVTWKVQNEARAVERLRRKLEKAAAGPVACCYEAGPCGYVLQRQLERGRVQCQVIAPALVPRKPGERIKTDRRDARKLAELHRAGLLTEVRPPTPAEEAVRDLCRARDDARADRQRCRHRLGKLLLRRGLHYPGRAWTQAHRRWVNGLTWPHPADRVVLDDYLLAIDQLDARLAELDAQLATVATTDPYREPVGWLRCFRGIDTLTAMLLLAELHDVQRFPTARALMAYLGLVPGEHSSGERHRRGPITKTGNTLARRLVVEAAWHYRHRPGVSRTLAQRRSGQPPRVIALADKAQQRRSFCLVVIGARAGTPGLAQCPATRSDFACAASMRVPPGVRRPNAPPTAGLAHWSTTGSPRPSAASNQRAVRRRQPHRRPRRRKLLRGSPGVRPRDGTVARRGPSVAAVRRLSTAAVVGGRPGPSLAAGGAFVPPGRAGDRCPGRRGCTAPGLAGRRAASATAAEFTPAQADAITNAVNLAAERRRRPGRVKGG